LSRHLGAPAARRRRPGLALGLLAALLPGLAVAQPAPDRPRLPGVGATDPRRPVELDQPPWRGFGRVQQDLGKRCSGALVGPRLVLTAAHCLVAPRSGNLVQPETLHFLLGYDRGGFAGHGRVTGFQVAPGYRPDGKGPRGADWALLTLDAPLGTPDRVLPLLDAPPPPRTPLMLGGYQQDRPERLLADTGCRAIGTAQGGTLLLHDCAGTHGASGAPVLAQGPDGRWAVAGVTSGAGVTLGGLAEVAMGVAVAVQGFAAAVR
jgi:protease YdgD